MNETKQNKSILDNFFELEVTGHCPICGAPIYGPKYTNCDKSLAIRYSCNCRLEGKPIGETMRTT